MNELEFTVAELKILTDSIDKYIDSKRTRLESSKVKTSNAPLQQAIEDERKADEALVDELSLLKAKLIMRRREAETEGSSSAN